MVGQASSLSTARARSPWRQGPPLPILLVKIYQGFLQRPQTTAAKCPKSDHTTFVHHTGSAVMVAQPSWLRARAARTFCPALYQSRVVRFRKKEKTVGKPERLRADIGFCMPNGYNIVAWGIAMWRGCPFHTFLLLVPILSGSLSYLYRNGFSTRAPAFCTSATLRVASVRS
jgi:hypothetical protein